MLVVAYTDLCWELPARLVAYIKPADHPVARALSLERARVSDPSSVDSNATAATRGRSQEPYPPPTLRIPLSTSCPMHNSSVLLVNPHHYHSSCPAAGRGLRSPVDMSGAKLNMRHYSLESPSLTSPPAYDILLPGAVGGAAGGDPGKHPCGGFSTGHIGAICSQNNVMGTPLSSPQFNPHLVMAPTAPPGLLHICKLCPWRLFGFFSCRVTAFSFARDVERALLVCVSRLLMRICIIT